MWLFWFKDLPWTCQHAFLSVTVLCFFLVSIFIALLDIRIRTILCQLITAAHVNELPPCYCLRVLASLQEINNHFNHSGTGKVSAQ